MPSGLVIYWIVNTLMSIVQQVQINRKFGPTPVLATAGTPSTREWECQHRVETTGRSVEEALQTALTALGAKPAEVRVEILDDAQQRIPRIVRQASGARSRRTIRAPARRPARARRRICWRSMGIPAEVEVRRRIRASRSAFRPTGDGRFVDRQPRPDAGGAATRVGTPGVAASSAPSRDCESMSASTGFAAKRNSSTRRASWPKRSRSPVARSTSSRCTPPIGASCTKPSRRSTACAPTPSARGCIATS